MIEAATIAYVIIGTVLYLRTLTYPALRERMRAWRRRSRIVFALALVSFTIKMIAGWPYWLWRSVQRGRLA